LELSTPNASICTLTIKCKTATDETCIIVHGRLRGVPRGASALDLGAVNSRKITAALSNCVSRVLSEIYLLLLVVSALPSLVCVSAREVPGLLNSLVGKEPVMQSDLRASTLFRMASLVLPSLVFPRGR
jgi:hypothetical protein